MSAVAIIGVTSLGIVIGWLVRYFIRRFKSYTPKTLSAIISIIVGGTVIRLFESDKSVWWFYPFGLLIGFVLYTLSVIYFSKSDANSDFYQNTLMKSSSIEDDQKE